MKNDHEGMTGSEWFTVILSILVLIACNIF